MTDQQPVTISEDIRRDAGAALGHVAFGFYERLLADTTSPRIREAVHQVLDEAAAEHRAGAQAPSAPQRATARRGRHAAGSQTP